MELSTRRPQASFIESQEWRRRIKCTCYYLPLRQAGHDRGMFASRLFSNASPSFTNSRRWLAANLLVVMCHFGALSCHFLLPYSWPNSTGSIYRKVIINGSLLEKLLVQLVPRQGWQMAEARLCSTRLGIDITHFQVLDKNVG